MTDQPGWRVSRRKRFEAAAIVAVGVPLAEALGRTWRWRVDGAQHLETVAAGGQSAVLVFWHRCLLPAMLFFRDRDIVALASENFDGEWAARIAHWFGYRTARGSSSRGAVRALVQLKRLMDAGANTAFAVDGPRGPALKVQPGCIWLAQATGSPIVPFHVGTRTGWTARSWDRTIVPKPWAEVAMVIGAPMTVEPELAEMALEQVRLRVEESLLALVRRADTLLGADDPGPAAPAGHTPGG